MAWLKIDHDTPDKPEILAIAAKLGISPGDAFLCCFRVWRWADQQTYNGHALGVTLVTLSSLIGRDGFAQAMLEVGWLDFADGSVRIPKFDSHVSNSAKRRALAAKRQSASRAKRDGARDGKRDNGVTGRVTKSKTLPSEENKNSGVPEFFAETPAEKPTPKPRARNDLFDAIVEVTGSSPRSSAAYIAKIVKSLEGEEPPYTPAEVRSLPALLAPKGFSLPLTLGTVEKYIGWTRTKETGLGRPPIERLGRIEAPPGKYDNVGITISAAAPKPGSRPVPPAGEDSFF